MADPTELRPEIDYFRELLQSQEYNKSVVEAIKRRHADLERDGPSIHKMLDFERRMLSNYEEYHCWYISNCADPEVYDLSALKFMYESYGFGIPDFYAFLTTTITSMDDFRFIVDFLTPLTPELSFEIENEYISRWNGMACVDYPNDMCRIEHLLNHGMSGFTFIHELIVDRFWYDFSTKASLQILLDNCIFKILSKIQTITHFEEIRHRVEFTVNEYELTPEQAANVYDLLYQFCPMPMKSARTREEREDDARKRSKPDP
jgi:hypothetical protein